MTDASLDGICKNLYLFEFCGLYNCTKFHFSISILFMRLLFKISAFIILFSLLSCSNGQPRISTKKQASIDKKLIQQYIKDQQLTMDSTRSGIYYHLDHAGYGDPPNIKSSVTADYEVALLDGTIVDSSYERGEAFAFKLAGVIDGWQEAIQLMGVAGKGKFIIPSGLAYKRRSVAGKIPPNSVLVFKIELLEAHDIE